MAISRNNLSPSQHGRRLLKCVPGTGTFDFRTGTFLGYSSVVSLFLCYKMGFAFAVSYFFIENLQLLYPISI